MQLDIVSNLNTQPWSGMLGGNSGPIWELQTGPTDWLVLLGMIFNFEANTGGGSTVTFGLGKPAAPGVGTSTQTFVIENNELTDVLPGSKLLTTWSTMPTVPANFMRRINVNNLATSVVGNGRIPYINWRFPNGLKIIPNSSLVLWGISLPQAFPSPFDSSLLIED